MKFFSYAFILMGFMAGFTAVMRADDSNCADLALKSMSNDERAYCKQLVRQFESEFLFLYGRIVSFVELSMMVEDPKDPKKEKKIPNNIAFRQYVNDLNSCVERFEQDILESVIEKMNNCPNHDSAFYKSLVIVNDACAKLLPPLQVLRGVMKEFVASNDKNQMAKTIAKKIEEACQKLPLAQTWESVETGFTRLKTLMTQLNEVEVLAEITAVENRLGRIQQNLKVMNIGVTKVIAALDQKLRNNGKMNDEVKQHEFLCQYCAVVINKLKSA